MRYAVLVKPPDDHPGAVRIFGTWRERQPALAFSEHVRAAVDHDIEDEASGYAYVMTIEAPKRRAAVRWATRGES